jgi:FkbM family methyltransferase
MVISSVKSWLNWKKRTKIVSKKITLLNIEDAGISKDSTNYIKLIDGPIFFGPKSSPFQKKIYKKLPSNSKKNLPEECFGIAMNIILRYFEGGLMSGGPKKEKYYQAKSSDIVAEMGAYMGYYCIYLSEKVGPQGRVFAIEPIKENIKYLTKNIRENNLKNVIIIPKGVWKERGYMKFHKREQDKQSGSISLRYKNDKENKIEVDSLDNILLENKIKNVNFMIIQLNGAEYDALLGLTKIKPENIAIAARYKKDGKPIALLISENLKSRGYSVKIEEGAFVYGSLNKKLFDSYGKKRKI